MGAIGAIEENHRLVFFANSFLRSEKRHWHLCFILRNNAHSENAGAVTTKLLELETLKDSFRISILVLIAKISVQFHSSTNLFGACQVAILSPKASR